MGDFDPDAYLADSSGPSAAPEENSFDPDKYLANFNPDEYLRSDQRPAPEGPVMSGLREAAHAAIPAAAGLVGAGLGAAAGALTSPVTGPVGPFVGGVGGMVAASMGADYVQSKALKWAGIDDDTQRAANIEANPKSSFIGGLAPAAATMSPVKGAQLAQRGFGALMMGGFEAGQEYLNEGNVDPTKVGIAAAVGAVAPAANRLGEKLMGSGARMVPGRPNRTANPDANQAHADVDDATPETAVGDSSLAEPPPGPDGVTTGNPQSAPERSDRVYPKENTAAPAEGDMLTQGHMDPATAAALDANQPATPSPAPEAAPTAEPSPQPIGPNAAKPTLGLKPRPEPVVSDRRYVQAMNGNPTGEPLPRLSPEGLEKLRALKARFAEENAAPPVETGFPKAGEPVAVGENEATPTPQREWADAGDKATRIARLNGEAPKLAEVMNRLKGKTNPEPTEGQKEAGNYEKARERLFGHEVAYENMKGSERTGTDAEGKPWSSTLPADYGYFRKTVGADKDHVDVYNLRNGDKNFIVDQRDPATGKFDEHKVMANAKDLDDARDTYLKAFSDEKGLARLHDITEVSPDELTQWLKGASKKKPYGAPVPKEKPLPKIVSKAIEMAKAEGRDDIVTGLQQMNPSKQGMVAAQYVNAKTNKTGVSDIKTPRIRPAAPSFKVGDTEITGRTLADVEFKSGSLEKVKAAFDKYTPAENETREATHRRLEDAMAAVGGATRYKPRVPPAEWMWAKRADRYMKGKMSERERGKFLQDETQLRGAPEDVENYRGGNRIEADIARSKRSGDEAVANAEAKQNQPGVNDTEDALINAIDAKRDAEFKTMKVVSKDKTRFDVPHEGAESMVEPTPVKTKADMKELPRKTIDIGDSALAKIDTNKISAAAMRKAEAAKLAGKKSDTGEVYGPPRIRKIDIGDAVERQRLLDAVNKVSQKKPGMEPLPAEPAPKVKRVAQDLYTHFMSDERGAVDVGKVYKDFKRLLQATDLTRYVDKMQKTPHKSYLAWKSEGPRDDYMRSLSTDLHRTGKLDVNSWAKTLNKAVREWPKEFDSASREKVFQARDADNAHVDLPGKQAGKTNVESLPADLKALYDKHLAPVFKENDKYAQNIHVLDPERIDPSMEHHVAHIMNGDTDQFNMLRDQDNPMDQGHYRGLSVNASAAEDRKFFALARNLDGKRFIVEPTNKGYDLWENGKRARIVDPDFKFENGKTLTVTAKNGQKIDYTMRQAMADEKTANALINKKPPKYFKDAGFAAMVTNAQLGSMARHLQVLSNIMNSNEFKAWSTHSPTAEQKKDGWDTTTMPNFEGLSMHPDMKAVFDDFAGQPQGWWQKLNAAVTKLIFISPTAHAIGNVGGHTFAARGWDNLSIPKNLAILQDIPFAVQDVLRQGKYQRKMNINGAGTIYGKVLTRDMPGQLAKAFGLEVERNPSRWGPVADKLGVPLMDLVHSVYRHVEGSMWAASDVMETLRLRELQRKGAPLQEALVDAERDIPNYRSPTKLFGSRFLAQQFFNNSMFTFSRYHHGMINAYASMAKGLLAPSSTMGDRVEAAGKLMAVGLMGMILAPLADEAFKKLTGNENAEAPRRGPLTIPSKIAGALNGKDDIAAPARAAVTMSPLVSTAGQALSNHDWRGKPIVEPGDVREGARGHAAGAARAIGSEAEHWARGLVAPYNMLSTTAKKAGPEDNGLMGAAKVVGRTIRDQALDIKDVSPKAANYERKVPITTHRDVTQRFRKGGNGPLEGLIDRVFGR